MVRKYLKIVLQHITTLFYCMFIKQQNNISNHYLRNYYDLSVDFTIAFAQFNYICMV